MRTTRTEGYPAGRDPTKPGRAALSLLGLARLHAPLASVAALFAAALFAAALCVAAVASAPAAAARPACAAAGSAWAATGQDVELDAELEALLDAERREADRLRRRGALEEARKALVELLDEEPEDPATRAFLARVHLAASDFDGAEREARLALAGGAPDARRRAALVLLERARELGLGATADAWLAEVAAAGLDVDGDVELRLARGELLLEAGRRDAAFADFTAGAELAATTWPALLARARCHRRLGRLVPASRDLVEADRAARAADGQEAEVLAELASLYFEADGEVADARTAGRAPGELYRQAVAIDPHSEAAGVGLLRLGRFNWRRQSAAPESYLEPVLAVRPRSVEALLARGEARLDDGDLPAVRQVLAQLGKVAPGRRAVRTLQAALAWVEHRRDDAEGILAELVAADPADAAPERDVGTHLVELYRFAEGLPFLARAVERDGGDWQAWTQLGRARANTGDVEGGLEALRRAEAEADGRRNAWRFNQRSVLERMERLFVEHRAGQLTFAWMPDEAPVLERYLVPFYEEARRALEERYGHRTGPVRIEVFRRHQDFSVRSTGFEGFPALGVCFGPVVTAVSPLAEMRGRFSWARTSFHEFTHVVHLALSNNRCPRWITEGLATWEEERVNRAWSRNMRVELVDARANGDLIPLRELNRAFRGPRVLFGYYQGGLLCRMLIESHGFPAMVRLLEAFDRGADLDRAMREVFGLTPDQIDARFAAFVDRELEGLRVEPNWRAERLPLLRLALDPRPPAVAAERAEWRERWIDLAFGAWQSGRRVDAEDALRRAEGDLAAGEPFPARADHLRGVMAFAAGDRELARGHWESFLARGGDDFRVRMALGELAYQKGEPDRARAHFEAAERCFPGYPEEHAAAELALARLLEEQGDVEAAIAARRRWLGYNADAGALRLDVARWLAERGRHGEASTLFSEANEIDPFQRALHVDWAGSLAALGRHAEALREFEVALLVPVELEPEATQPLTDAERADLEGRAAEQLLALGRADEARARARAALERAPGTESALRVLERLP